MINICQTYEIVTHESAEHGEAEETGFEFQDVPHTFAELVKLMEEHPEASSGGEVNERTWFSYHPSDPTNFTTGEFKSTSIHFSRSNKPSDVKYWIKAAAIAHGKSKY